MCGGPCRRRRLGIGLLVGSWEGVSFDAAIAVLLVCDDEDSKQLDGGAWWLVLAADLRKEVREYVEHLEKLRGCLVLIEEHSRRCTRRRLSQGIAATSNVVAFWWGLVGLIDITCPYRAFGNSVASARFAAILMRAPSKL